jgi:hypothetical protein
VIALRRFGICLLVCVVNQWILGQEPSPTQESLSC